ncbi:MAG: radical SAM family heme chaperone HemW, partial [Dongiaceae bacterium]
HATRQRDRIEPRDRLAEMTMMGLRLAEGIAHARFVAETGCQPEAAFAPAGLHRLIDGGFLVLDAAGLRATPAGLQRLNAVLGELLG